MPLRDASTRRQRPGPSSDEQPASGLRPVAAAAPRKGAPHGSTDEGPWRCQAEAAGLRAGGERVRLAGVDARRRRPRQRHPTRVPGHPRGSAARRDVSVGDGDRSRRLRRRRRHRQQPGRQVHGGRHAGVAHRSARQRHRPVRQPPRRRRRLRREHLHRRLPQQPHREAEFGGRLAGDIQRPDGRPDQFPPRCVGQRREGLCRRHRQEQDPRLRHLRHPDAGHQRLHRDVRLQRPPRLRR